MRRSALLAMWLGAACYAPDLSAGDAAGTVDVLDPVDGPTTRCRETPIFRDDFTGTEVDGAKWTAFADVGAMVYQTTGQAVLHLDDGLAVGADAEIFSVYHYDLIGRRVAVEVAALPSLPGPEQALVAYLDSGNVAGVLSEGGAIYCGQTIGGTYGRACAETPLGASHRFWGLRESGGTLFFETSADGFAWNTLASEPVPFAFDYIQVGLYLLMTAEGTGGGEARLEETWVCLPP